MQYLRTLLRRPVRRRAATGLAALLLAVASYTVGAWRTAADPPGAEAVDLGFTRDMIIHHSQAVTLATLVLQRATVPAVREMADEIATSQQYEVGVMTGWLQQWGHATSTAEPAMSWMTHGPAVTPGTDPPMPGMATRRDVARLAVTRGVSADLLFCRLMLPHHRGGLHMINEVIERGTRPELITLAEQMRAVQQREIKQLTTLLAKLPPAGSSAGGVAR